MIIELKNLIIVYVMNVQVKMVIIKIHRIYISLYELKNHCLNFHKGSLDKCIINYRLLPGFIEVEIKKDAKRYIIHMDDLLTEDKNDVLLGISFRLPFPA